MNGKGDGRLHARTDDKKIEANWPFPPPKREVNRPKESICPACGGFIPLAHAVCWKTDEQRAYHMGCADRLRTP